jgi:galactose mutarotase-like enzyme
MTPTIENPSWGEKRDGAHVGSIADNSAVDLYTLKDEGIEVEVISYGARIVSIRTPDLYGKIANVVLGYSRLGSYIADQASYLGAAVRRYANRIASGRFSIGDHSYQASTNNHGNIHCMVEYPDSTVGSGQRSRSPPE